MRHLHPPLSIHAPKRRSALHAACAVALALATCAWTSLACAQDAASYPDRPIKIVVPFPPGGAADVFARLVGQKLGEAFGGEHGVVVDNRAGAGGVIGTEVAAKSPADGSTFLMVTIGHAVNPFMYSKLPYDTRADLVPVGVVAMCPAWW